MSDEIMLVFGEDGVAREYDDTWDITIHCESEEEQKAVLEKLNNSNQEAKHSTESSSTHKALPSAQPEIIRCKDCEYCVPGYITDNDDFIPPRCGRLCQTMRISGDDYCSFGERRTDE